MKQIVIAAVLVGATAWIAHMHVESQTYHPVVRVASPDGLTYTAVFNPTHERRACGAANDRFLGPMKEICKQCRVVIARCERQLDGLELALSYSLPIPYHGVYTPAVRVAIAGPADKAKSSCEYIAGDMAKRGVRRAACVYPRLRPAGS